MRNTGLPKIIKVLRSTHGVTQERLAERLRVSTSLIAKFETARLVPMPDTARNLDEVFGSGDLIQELATDARKALPPEWFQAWPEIELEAVSLRSHEPNFVPGLLQTEEYARALLNAGLLSPDEAEERLTLRMQRQTAVFGREKPLVCTFVIDELALMRGSPTLMKPQLEKLAEWSTRQLIFIHVVPRSAGLYVGQTGPLVLAALPGGGETAYLEDQASGRVIADPDQVAAMVRVWDAIRSVALPRDMSRDLIVRMASEL
ncbi:helix-turn-helix transcriptional regulator [Plantactinospora sp. S1510]|uniref:Helix-turn-helix transcriptional regulator n=1 Tax=Plantactinospora alkalitolerans TaxID=2789879 RepID=A0ABS0H3G2_9ACTN|nr:helix-turn-helix transcriptional regulator [Plantactinospora alkalitolerans]MBF9133003.1 helix-turn-helix transcriptional regulator [Plantactinospora alkalitolerans]